MTEQHTQDNKRLPKRKDCKCKCHNDGTIRHTKDDICCKRPDVYGASQQCNCETEDWHTGCSIDPYFTIGRAKITDVKGHKQMEKLQKYTGCVILQFDEKTKSLDIHFKRSVCEWNDGAGIQLNELTETDKEALRKYLEMGE